jgi:PAS domain S-box-containing protein
MKANPPKEDALTENSTGTLTATRKKVRERGAKRALINGRSVHDASKSDSEQARQELMGGPHTDPTEVVVESVPKSACLAPVPGRDTRIEQAETRIEQAETRTEQAETRTEQAETRTEQAETRTEQAETRMEHAETRSEQAIRASELSYRRLFEAARDGILILDIDTGRVTDVNPFLVELLGLSHGEMVGKTVGELSPFKDIESNKVMLARLQKDGYVRYEDLPLKTRDGRHVDVEFVSNVYQAGDKKVIQCNIRNITERKRAEEQMRDVQAQLELTNSDLRKRTEEIQYFYHTLAHELKTPLTSAREFVSIVIDGLAGELNLTQLNYLRIAKQSCTELAVYINDLLDATRLDTGKLHVELKAVSLAAIIRRAMAIMEPVAAGKKIRLSEELDTDLKDVMADESRIMQILTNLLNNALKFTAEDGAIMVKLGANPKNSECVQISVVDTGCGIPTDQIDNLFHRFYQIKKGDTTPGKGVGLGLFLCRELVLLHGGSIWVESVLGEGSTFSFTIPKHSDQTTTSRRRYKEVAAGIKGIQQLRPSRFNPQSSTKELMNEKNTNCRR